jgi:hypothetical protein
MSQYRYPSSWANTGTHPHEPLLVPILMSHYRYLSSWAITGTHPHEPLTGTHPYEPLLVPILMSHYRYPSLWATIGTHPLEPLPVPILMSHYRYPYSWATASPWAISWVIFNKSLFLFSLGWMNGKLQFCKKSDWFFYHFFKKKNYINLCQVTNKECWELRKEAKIAGDLKCCRVCRASQHANRCAGK